MESKKFELDSSEGKWFGEKAETEGFSIQDPGEGKAVFLRIYEFKRNPAVQLPSQQEIFNAHWNQIRDFLWKDGLRAIEGISPRIVITGDTYRIFTAAEAKAGVTILETPKTLQKALITK